MAPKLFEDLMAEYFILVVFVHVVQCILSVEQFFELLLGNHIVGTKPVFLEHRLNLKLCWKFNDLERFYLELPFNHSVFFSPLLFHKIGCEK